MCIAGPLHISRGHAPFVYAYGQLYSFLFYIGGLLCIDSLSPIMFTFFLDSLTLNLFGPYKFYPVYQ